MLWLLPLFLLCAHAGADIRQLTLAANDLVYSSLTGKIYASVPSRAGSIGNSITAIDPITGTIGPSIYVGSEPNRLAVSDDGRYLYVGLDGAGAARRFDLLTQTLGPPFWVGADPVDGPFFVEDLQVLPAHPETVAVVRRNIGYSPMTEGVAIFDNGVPRPNATRRNVTIDTIQPSLTDTRLFGLSNEISPAMVSVLAVDASGASVINTLSLATYPFEMRFANGRLYTSTGEIIDPSTLTITGTLPVHGLGSHLAVDEAARRVFFLSGMTSTLELQSFDVQTLQPAGELTITHVSGYAGGFIAWGQERDDGGGLAFDTDHDRVFLIRTPLVPPSARPAAASRRHPSMGIKKP
jgi:hypothetical protein